ncbi:MAG: DNA-3-methyladenine glycosylase I, partial [Casimicrobiaceae bacterium]
MTGRNFNGAGRVRQHNAYIWRFVGGAPLQNARATLQDVPAKTPTSHLLSRNFGREALPSGVHDHVHRLG